MEGETERWSEAERGGGRENERGGKSIVPGVLGLVDVGSIDCGLAAQMPVLGSFYGVLVTVLHHLCTVITHYVNAQHLL